MYVLCINIFHENTNKYHLILNEVQYTYMYISGKEF